MNDLKRCKVYYLGIAKEFKDIMRFYDVNSIFPFDFNARVESVFCGKDTIGLFKQLRDLKSQKIEGSFGNIDGIDFFVNENLPPDTFMVVSNELYRNQKSFGPFDKLDIIWG